MGYTFFLVPTAEIFWFKIWVLEGERKTIVSLTPLSKETKSNLTEHEHVEFDINFNIDCNIEFDIKFGIKFGIDIDDKSEIKK